MDSSYPAESAQNTQTEPASPQFIVVTGLSGAGKGLAASHFEDFGFFCVDNIPPSMLADFGRWCRHEGVTRASVVVDIRSDVQHAHPGEFFAGLQTALETLRADGLQPQILFLEADEERLVQRFKTTRRKHPLSNQYGDLGDALAAEREALSMLRGQADKVVNTSVVTPRELRRIIEETFVEDATNAEMLVQLESFGFKYGPPHDADLMFDVRFLPNPNYEPTIGHLTGYDESVINFVLREPVTQQFQEHLGNYVGFCVPQFEREGKAYLSVAIGCTGGRHRSVVLSNWLAEQLRSAGHRVRVTHRDIARADKSGQRRRATDYQSSTAYPDPLEEQNPISSEHAL